MDCIISLPIKDILGQRLLDFFIFSNIEVVGSLEIDGIHMGINGSHQLPHTRGIFFIGSTHLTLNRGRKSQVWDLLQVPQWGILEHPYCLKGC